jgi:hypothetical protein
MLKHHGGAMLTSIDLTVNYLVMLHSGQWILLALSMRKWCVATPKKINIVPHRIWNRWNSIQPVRHGGKISFAVCCLVCTLGTQSLRHETAQNHGMAKKFAQKHGDGCQR